MLESIAMWGGVAGVGIALIAMINLFLTRKGIMDAINKDNILYGENFAHKKSTITKALDLVDDVYQNGKSLIMNPNFADKAKACYNDLLCVVADVEVANQFFNIALNNELPLAEKDVLLFKAACRKDIGLKSKGIKSIRISNAVSSGSNYNQAPTTPQSNGNFGGLQIERTRTEQNPKPEVAPQPVRKEQPQVTQTYQPLRSVVATPDNMPKPEVPQQQPRPINRPAVRPTPAQPNAAPVRPTRPVGRPKKPE